MEACRGGVEARRGPQKESVESYLPVWGRQSLVSGNGPLGVTSVTIGQLCKKIPTYKLINDQI